MAGQAVVRDEDVVYHLRDINTKMVEAWAGVFSDYKEHVKVTKGDIFEGGPEVDAIVSPANSFGFMDGGIDLAYSRHFGSQMQKRLQKIIREELDGEILVGQAVIMPSYPIEGRDETRDWSRYNGGRPIQYLISAPTMRVPADVSETPNAYLAFRAIILAVCRHNKTSGLTPIRSVLVPGLGTNVGMMPKLRCAWQRLQAYETFALRLHQFRIHPDCLTHVYMDQEKLCEEEKYAIVRSPQEDPPPVANNLHDIV